MAVPNTTTFTLQNVVDEIAGTQTSLSACFADANPSGFDPLYEGSKNSLLNFRNYNDNPVVDTLTISPTTKTVLNSGETFNIVVTSNTTWTVSDNAAWLSFIGNSNSGNDTFSVTATANAGAERIGIVTVAWSGTNRTCTITQPSGGA